MQDAPYHGHFIGPEHRFAIRVYFEDTDFSGVVYHANYLRFFERARSDMLRVAGIDQAAAHEAGTGVYAVAAMDLKFRAPAHFDDALLIRSHVTAVRGASCVIAQRLFRDDLLLCEASVTAAFVSPSGRPTRQPKDWLAIYEALMADTDPLEER
ncbi:tol-pal system-associated acyl-CoA thioesterase [Novosphingopyxis sp. YJ-S2-01]|mgnify:CR=1 FL=1|uniref:tol-pal system-associated acyl-CoA thioesterase n=1 Tax=Novosphingopyxis sp. YJ-S2-01 TaxID=2794021 RepID=UPI000C58FBAB|nr:tol-pal system-associated acyl-CoA thioesterase [Novosphingopyxis sp. YJ-S2-01]MAC11588.1 tol-pal system-associated acyl-CoA thioesterase [Sphingorhabdus sp.]MBH9536348.1 tol-pal system-associated acyl-CoA thioesterase [Novosphingopyxis sp. YJ-S2-01]|tara:strand:+ start:388 stop:849 length:462 start_codon:yes stop_codon:yes gene_type:complete